MWLTTQQHQSAVAFLPVNPFLTPLRNQGRQKLATLDVTDFQQLLIDILTDTKRRQALSLSKSGVCVCVCICVVCVYVYVCLYVHVCIMFTCDKCWSLFRDLPLSVMLASDLKE